MSVSIFIDCDECSFNEELDIEPYRQPVEDPDRFILRIPKQLFCSNCGETVVAQILEKCNCDIPRNLVLNPSEMRQLDPDTKFYTVYAQKNTICTYCQG